MKVAFDSQEHILFLFHAYGRRFHKAFIDPKVSFTVAGEKGNKLVIERKAVSALILTLLLTGMLTVAFDAQPVKSDYAWTETIYIRADGSIQPSTAPISSVDNVTYTLTDNIAGNVPDSSSAIVIQRDNIVIDGAGYTVQGTGNGTGVSLAGKNSVTIKNTNVRDFAVGICLYWPSGNSTISGNNITNGVEAGIWCDGSCNAIVNNSMTGNADGISISGSSNYVSGNNVMANQMCGIRLNSWSSINNNVTGNDIVANGWYGIDLSKCSGNTISGNHIANNQIGVGISLSSDNNITENDIAGNSDAGIFFCCGSYNNTVSENNVTNNGGDGIRVEFSSNNTIYHNDFRDNTQQVYIEDHSQNAWDDGYPSGGNYWSDYARADFFRGPYQNETGSDGMGDTPYVIDLDNQDNYPLMNPWPSGWKLDFTEPTNHPIVDFAVYDGSLYAAADNRLYVKDGDDWNVVDAPAFVTSLGTARIPNLEPPLMKWNKTYGGANWDTAYDVVQTNDGGYALAGGNGTGSGGTEICDFWLVKTDGNGKEEWNMTYGGTGYDYAYALVQTSDGGYALAGFTGSFGGGNYDAWLVKTDANGNQQWNLTYGGTGWEEAHDMVQTSDGGYALVGYNSSEYESGDHDFWLVKTDANGTMQWSKTYGGTGWDQANALVQTGDGGYALAGRTESFGAGGRDFWLVRTDAAGNEQWNMTYGGASNDDCLDLVRTSDGGFALTGWTYSFGAGSSDFWLVKTYPNGVMQWNRTYGETGYDEGRGLAQTIDGGYALVGWTSSCGNGDFWLVKTNSIGEMQWNETYGGTDSDEAYDLVQTSDGGYALAGFTLSFGAGNRDFWLVKTEPYDAFKERLVVGGQGGLYCYDGSSFSLIFSVPTYIKVLGVWNNTLYAGTMLDRSPKLYYCSSSPENPANWHVDTGFSSILNFSGVFGSIDSFAAFNSSIGNPVGYWKFDEGSGLITSDWSGNGNDGLLINGPCWADGINGSALSFDGNDDYVRVPNSASLTITGNQITVEMWIKSATSLNDTTPQINFLDKGNEYGFQINHDNLYPTPDGRIWFFVVLPPGPTTAWEGIQTATNQWNADTWYHIAGTYDGSYLRVYVNAELENSRPLSGNLFAANAYNLSIGSYTLGNQQFFNGTMDEVMIYNHSRTTEEIWNDYNAGIMYVASGGTLFYSDGTTWRVARTFDDVMALADMQVYNGKLYLATRDQGWRKPMYQGGTGFSGRVIEFDGENWTTVLEHDYWIYSLEEYDGKLYAGTANKILTYNGTDWETSFNATEGAYYATCFENYDGKIYAGMGNGYIFADPAPAKANPENIVVPEFPPTAILAVFMALTMLAVALTRKNRSRRFI